MTILVVSK